MTEQEWLTCDDSRLMLQWMASRWRRRLATWAGFRCPQEQRRKFYLFVGECCGRSTAGVPHPGDDALMANVRLGSGKLTPERFEAILEKAPSDRNAAVAIEAWAASWALAAARQVS